MKNTFKLILYIIVLLPFYSYCQFNSNIYPNEVYFESNNPKYVIILKEDSRGKYEIDTINQCKENNSPIIRFQYYYCAEISEILSADYIEEKGIQLIGKDSVFNYKNFDNNINSEYEKILFVGEIKNVRVKKCKVENEKSTIIKIRDFLNKKSYNVETNGEVNSSFKRGIAQFVQDNGLPNHWYYQIRKIININWDELKQMFCDCLIK